MPTLRSLATVATGLYRDIGTGQAYRRDELLSRLAPELLDTQVSLRKLAPGVYTLGLGGGERRFELLSRRRTPRPELRRS